MARYDVDSITGLADAVRRATPFDRIELNGTILPDWHIALSEDGWHLANGRRIMALAGPGAARMCIVHGGVPHLLVGDNGYPSIQSAIDAAAGGEIILVAPGTYGEGRAFTFDEMACPGLGGDTCGLVVNKPVTLWGVSETGAPVTSCDDVVAAAVAQFQSGDGESFMVTVAGVSIHGLGFVPVGQRGGGAGIGKVFGIHRGQFTLRASVIERNPVRRAASAIHLRRRDDADPAQGVFISGNILHGSVTLDGSDTIAPMSVTIIDNDIFADRLPPVWVNCDARLLSAAVVDPVLPLLENNSLHVGDDQHFSLAIQCGSLRQGGLVQARGFNAYIARILETHEAAGAVIVEPSGRLRLLSVPDSAAGRGIAQGMGIFASIQAAIDDAQQDDTIYIGAGTYHEPLTMSGRHLTLLGATDADGNPLVRLEAPEPVADNDAAPRGDAIDIPGPAETPPPAASAVAMSEETRELAGESILDLLDSDAGRVPPVRRLGKDGLRKGGYATVQAALEAAEDGDRIEVAAGHHAGDLRIARAVTLLGANAGRPGSSAHRGLESTIEGHVVISLGAADVIIDGLSIQGCLTTELATDANPHLAVRCCVIDARNRTTAIAVLSGSGTMIASNLIVSGTDEAIYAPYGFDDLVVSGNRIEIAEGAAGIVLNGGPGLDSAYILGNTTVGGDYGVLVEVDGGLDQPGDSITIAGNCFGELRDGTPSGAPAVAAICADGPLPRALERSLGASLESNTYNRSPVAAQVDITFTAQRSRSPQRANLPSVRHATRPKSGERR